MRRLPRAGWWAAVPVLAPLVVFAQGLAGRIVLAPGDGLQYYLPLHVLAGRAWRDGQLPSWNPWSFSGSPLLATGQAAVFYPLNLLFAVLGPVPANNLTVVLHYVVAGLGGWFLAKRLTGDPAAAAVAGLAYALSGFMVGHLGHQAIIASAAWFPWLLLVVDRVAERITPARVAQGGAVLGLAILAGHVQTVAFSLLFAGVYAVALAVGGVAGRWWRPLLGGAAVVVAGAALAAVQLGPTLAVLDATDRASQLSFEEATSFSLPGSHAVLAFFPYAFGAGRWPFSAPYGGQWNLTELAGYCGLAALVLAVVGVALHARVDRRVWALAAMGAVAFVLALGPATPVSRLVHAVPVFGSFRSWGRYLMGFDLAVAALAAYGVAGLRTAGAAARRRAVRAAAATAGLAVLVAVTMPWLPKVRGFVAGDRTGLAARALPALAALAAVGVVVALARRRRGAAALACLLVAGDLLVSYGWWYEWRHPVHDRATVDALLDDEVAPPWGGVPDAPGGVDRWLFASADVRWALPEFPALTDEQGLRSANGFDPLAPEAYMAAAGAMAYNGAVADAPALLDPASWTLDLLRVTRVVAHPDSTARSPEVDAALAAATPVPERALVALEVRPRLPEAFVVGATRVVPDVDELTATVQGQRGPFAADGEALVDEPCDACPGSGPGAAGPAGEAGPVTWGRSSARLRVRADRPGLLVVSQAWFPGWTATVDGRAADVVAANGLVTGVPVPAGEHEVVLRYRPPGLTAGALVSALAGVGLAGWWALDRRRVRATRALDAGAGGADGGTAGADAAAEAVSASAPAARTT